jgi:hypothetical protein
VQAAFSVPVVQEPDNQPLAALPPGVQQGVDIAQTRLADFARLIALQVDFHQGEGGVRRPGAILRHLCHVCLLRVRNGKGIEAVQAPVGIFQFPV